MAADERDRPDPLGRAMFDYQRGDLGTLRYRDGADVRDGRVAEYYFEPPERWGERTVRMLERFASWDGPVPDAGCGAGQHALWLQDRGVEVTGIDVSPNEIDSASSTRSERRSGSRDRSRDSETCSRSSPVSPTRRGSPSFTTTIPPRSTGIFWVSGRTRGTVSPTARFTSSTSTRGTTGGRRLRATGRTRVAGPTLQFLLFGPGRLAEATIGTPWDVSDVDLGDETYVAVLEKRP